MSETSRAILDAEGTPDSPEELQEYCFRLAREVEALEAAQQWRQRECIRYIAALVRLCAPDKLPAKWGELVDRDAVVDAAMNIKRILESAPPEVTP